ncbi:MAG TPA: radical SAM protein [Verrucomicrobia bacterium]|nr:MAG: hypothetical protein A2X46_13735 [Lentisphaerae bacterium GWF2_57_35]HBA82464.1 radical SAM protein [Verrucomicrobiota bacterium]
MLSIYDIDRVNAFCRQNRISDHPLKRLRIAFFKKGLPIEDCLEVLPEEHRAAVAGQIRMQYLHIVERHDSKRDGATKLVFQTADRQAVEAVILRITSGRTSLCISSQVGCGVDCAFCASGRGGLTRNLTADEMLDQVALAMRLLRSEGRVVRNVVVMGTGEPLHNEEALFQALETLRDPRGFYLSDRHLMVSTAGLSEAMLRFVERFPSVRLALSLHSARQEVREQIMPTAKFQTLEKLREIFPKVGKHNNFMIEYLLLKGINDGPEDLAALIDYLRGIPAHINLIQFNPHPGTAFQPVSKAAREAFGDVLRKAGFKVTLRYSLGDDIAAACGQLAGRRGKYESLVKLES